MSAVAFKTWPYGSTRHAEVVSVEESGTRLGKIVALKDELGEGHVLIGPSSSDPCEPTDRGVLVFTQGGPTGGFWRFVNTTRCVDVCPSIGEAIKNGAPLECELMNCHEDLHKNGEVRW